MFTGVDTRHWAGCTRSRENRHRSISPGLERLEDRSLLTKIVDLGALMIPYAINSAGEVVGTSPGGTGAFLEYPPGNPIYLTPPKPNESLIPTSVNDAGEIVGDSVGLAGEGDALAYILGEPTDLGSLSRSGQSEATDINLSGEVVGSSDSEPFRVGPDDRNAAPGDRGSRRLRDGDQRFGPDCWFFGDDRGPLEPRATAAGSGDARRSRNRIIRKRRHRDQQCGPDRWLVADDRAWWPYTCFSLEPGEHAERSRGAPRR
jgi:hypothetical protein